MEQAVYSFLCSEMRDPGIIADNADDFSEIGVVKQVNAI
jgi:hypothetical protein